MQLFLIAALLGLSESRSFEETYGVVAEPWELLSWFERQSSSRLQGFIDLSTRQDGNCSFPIELVLVDDSGSSHADALAALRDVQFSLLAQSLSISHPGSRFGIVFYRDKPVWGFGSPDDYCQEVILPLSPWPINVAEALSHTSVGLSDSDARNQLGALVVTAESPKLGWSSDPSIARIALLRTHAHPRFADDGQNSYGMLPFSGYKNDSYLDEQCTQEYYPSPSQVKTALDDHKIYLASLVTDEDEVEKDWRWFNSFLGQTSPFVQLVDDDDDIQDAVDRIIEAIEAIECPATITSTTQPATTIPRSLPTTSTTEPATTIPSTTPITTTTQPATSIPSTEAVTTTTQPATTIPSTTPITTTTEPATTIPSTTPITTTTEPATTIPSTPPITSTTQPATTNPSTEAVTTTQPTTTVSAPTVTTTASLTTTMSTPSPTTAETSTTEAPTTTTSTSPSTTAVASTTEAPTTTTSTSPSTTAETSGTLPSETALEDPSSALVIPGDDDALNCEGNDEVIIRLKHRPMRLQLEVDNDSPSDQ